MVSSLSAQKKEKHLKGAGNSRMFLFHQKTLFFSFLFFGGEYPHARHAQEVSGIHLFFLSVLFTYYTLSYIQHRAQSIQKCSFCRTLACVSFCVHKRPGEKWPSLRPAFNEKEDGSHAELKERTSKYCAARAFAPYQAKALIYFFLATIYQHHKLLQDEYGPQ